MDDESQRTYDADIKRQHDNRSTVYTSVGTSAPMPKPVTERLADLCKRVADMGYEIARARTRQRATTVSLQESEAAFAKVANELLRAIDEHREGTPEQEASR